MSDVIRELQPGRRLVEFLAKLLDPEFETDVSANRLANAVAQRLDRSPRQIHRWVSGEAAVAPDRIAEDLVGPTRNAIKTLRDEDEATLITLAKQAIAAVQVGREKRQPEPSVTPAFDRGYLEKLADQGAVADGTCRPLPLPATVWLPSRQGGQFSSTVDPFRDALAILLHTEGGVVRLALRGERDSGKNRIARRLAYELATAFLPGEPGQSLFPILVDGRQWRSWLERRGPGSIDDDRRQLLAVAGLRAEPSMLRLMASRSVVIVTNFDEEEDDVAWLGATARGRSNTSGRPGFRMSESVDLRARVVLNGVARVVVVAESPATLCDWATHEIRVLGFPDVLGAARACRTALRNVHPELGDLGTLGNSIPALADSEIVGETLALITRGSVTAATLSSEGSLLAALVLDSLAESHFPPNGGGAEGVNYPLEPVVGTLFPRAAGIEESTIAALLRLQDPGAGARSGLRRHESWRLFTVIGERFLSIWAGCDVTWNLEGTADATRAGGNDPELASDFDLLDSEAVRLLGLKHRSMRHEKTWLPFMEGVVGVLEHGLKHPDEPRTMWESLATKWEKFVALLGLLKASLEKDDEDPDLERKKRLADRVRNAFMAQWEEDIEQRSGWGSPRFWGARAYASLVDGPLLEFEIRNLAAKPSASRLAFYSEVALRAGGRLYPEGPNQPEGGWRPAGEQDDPRRCSAFGDRIAASFIAALNALETTLDDQHGRHARYHAVSAIARLGSPARLMQHFGNLVGGLPIRHGSLERALRGDRAVETAIAIGTLHSLGAPVGPECSRLAVQMTLAATGEIASVWPAPAPFFIAAHALQARQCMTPLMTHQQRFDILAGLHETLPPTAVLAEELAATSYLIHYLWQEIAAGIHLPPQLAAEVLEPLVADLRRSGAHLSETSSENQNLRTLERLLRAARMEPLR